MVRNISFFSSSICNLNCSFCYLHKNNSYKTYDEIIVKAWEDQSYIDNVVKSLKKLEEDPNQINSIEFWGGETLAHIDKITPCLDSLINNFPNLHYINISTNWSIKIEDFIIFLVKLDKLVTKDILINLQLSIDGIGDYQLEGHNINFKTYKDNIKLFTDYFNNNTFNHVYIEFQINSTINKNLYLSSFDDTNNMVKYFTSMRELVKYLENNCRSRHLHCKTPYVFPSVALPYTSTTEDGLKLAKICRSWESIINNSEKANCQSLWYHGLGNIDFEFSLFESNPECAELSNALTFLPDGKIVQCSGSFLDANPNYLNELLENNEYEEYSKAIKFKDFLFDPLQMTKEDVENFKWYIVNGVKNNNLTFIHLAMIIADEMSQSEQIPYYFHNNPEYLWTLISGMLYGNTCIRENLRDNGNVFISSPSCIRQHLNGVMQYINEIQTTENQKVIRYDEI